MKALDKSEETESKEILEEIDQIYQRYEYDFFWKRLPSEFDEEMVQFI